MKRKLPPLNTLRAFEAAARHLSFTRAAEELHVTHGAVGQAIKTLENYYQQQLFVRSRGKVSLNSAGRKLLPVVAEALDKIERVGARLDDDVGAEVLTIQLTSAFAAQWLIPRLSDFQQRYPQLTIRLSPSHRFSGFQHGEPDVAIRYGITELRAVTTEKLFDVDTFAACAPSLLSGEQPLRIAEDLQQHRLIHDDDGEAWRALLEEAGVDAPEAGKGLYYADASLALQAAVEGEGVIVAGSILAARDLAAGRLVIPFDTFVRRRNAYYLYFPKLSEGEEKVQAFRSWIHDNAQLYLREKQDLQAYLAPREG
ncbi:MAG: transcriptional regulator GcvA [Proteobacteria bacterium]|nr:transcriptional regulator GcvA [Pseudomonadota bacterium]